MPMSFGTLRFLGGKSFRQFCAKLILGDRCGQWVNIERGVHFGDGLTIGNGSSIGANSNIPSSVVIGDNVMMEQEVLMFISNNLTDRLDVPMGAQGLTETNPITNGDAVWIGVRVTFFPDVHVGNGAVIGAGAVITKDIPNYEIWGGNPASKLKSRKETDD